MSIEIRERYRALLEKGCCTTDLPWDLIDEVLLQRKYFLDQFGSSPQADMGIGDLALIAASALAVKVPPLAREGLERERKRAKEVEAMKAADAKKAKKPEAVAAS